MANVSLRNLKKSYDGVDAVRNVDLEIDQAEFVAFVGPSGCGKTTTLRMIAGLEEITSGEIWIGDRLANDLAPGQRDIAMVFQNYSLYPHMSVADNISFGLRQHKRMPREDINRRVAEVARMLEIEPLLDRKPRALSGGQRQRVAMGRAIVRNPQVFLFDEPLSNLDAQLRVQMRAEIKKLHQALPTTTIYVTHDQVEAMTMADRVVVMNGGLVEQVGPPQELYARPLSKFVAGFIGSPAMNFFTVRVEQNGNGVALRLTDDQTLAVPAERARVYKGYGDQEMILGLRPEAMTEPREKPGSASLKVVADLLEPLGVETLMHFSLNGDQFCARLDPSAAPARGQLFTLSVDITRMHLIAPGTGKVVYQ